MAELVQHKEPAMGKGSSRRPGTNYATNWEATFGKKEGQERTGWPPGMLQDDSYPLAHALSSKPDARQHVRDVAIAAAVQKYGAYPGKVWHAQPDGSLLPADGGAPLLQPKTCQHCRHWGKEHGFSNGDGTHTNGCGSDALHAHLSERAEFWPPADFGCNRWVAKV